MFYLYSIEKLIGIQEAEKISIEGTPEKTVIHIRMRRKLHTCPACGEETNRIHDYWDGSKGSRIFLRSERQWS